MEPLTPEQMAAKVLYLERENAQLRAENLDLRVRAGIIRLAPPQGTVDSTTEEGRGEDG